MTTADIKLLHSYTDKRVRVIATDGEEMIVKVLFLSDEYQDFICDIISTTHESRYKAQPKSYGYTIAYNDVASFSLVIE